MKIDLSSAVGDSRGTNITPTAGNPLDPKYAGVILRRLIGSWLDESKLLLRRRFTVSGVSFHGVTGSSSAGDGAGSSSGEAGLSGVSGVKTCSIDSGSGVKSCSKGTEIGVSWNEAGVSIVDKPICFVVKR